MRLGLHLEHETVDEYMLWVEADPMRHASFMRGFAAFIEMYNRKVELYNRKVTQHGN